MLRWLCGAAGRAGWFCWISAACSEPAAASRPLRATGQCTEERRIAHTKPTEEKCLACGLSAAFLPLQVPWGASLEHLLRVLLPVPPLSLFSGLLASDHQQDELCCLKFVSVVTASLQRRPTAPSLCLCRTQAVFLFQHFWRKINVLKQCAQAKNKFQLFLFFSPIKSYYH